MERAPRHGRRRALDVAARADGRAATPFESAVRALSWRVPGLLLGPQVTLAPSVTPDLTDVALRLVVECDSWTYHAERTAFHRDQERHNDLLLEGWLVLRFGLPHVLERPDHVVRTLARASRCSVTKDDQAAVRRGHVSGGRRGPSPTDRPS